MICLRQGRYCYMIVVGCEPCNDMFTSGPLLLYIVVGCEPCECNGHGDVSVGSCHNETGVCYCTHDTHGSHCQHCHEGYYGDPRSDTHSLSQLIDCLSLLTELQWVGNHLGMYPIT